MRVLILLAVLVLSGCHREFLRYERCVEAYRDNKAMKASATEVHEVCIEASAQRP